MKKTASKTYQMSNVLSRQNLECGGQYVCNEWVVKKVEYNHPCKLIEIKVKITAISGMKNRVLNSLLGSKTSNLFSVMRCEGQCGNNDPLNTIKCLPTKIYHKTVKIDIKTSYRNNVQNVSR